MAIYKCKMCGGSLEANGESSVATCEYCGSVQTLPKKNDEVITNLFNRANNLRIKCEFDKAAEVYEKILNEDNNDSEAHWGLVLCKYGIEYVEDPKTYKRIPTCHRTQYESILTDVDYLAAVSNADAFSADIYKAQAEEIANLQKDILAIVKNEKPFDAFICYKETDENGKRTVDSTLANDIYYQLTQEGLKVFYAAITLEDKLGVEYEPYIFAALNSAKVMLVVGTKPEYFDAIWVKNEWSRYLKLMKADRSKLLIPCYRDMDAYDLPEEFSHLQAQDMSKIGFVNDVVRGIKKVVKADEPKVETVVKETVVASDNTNVVPLLKRAFMFLEDGDWANADEYCEKVLDIDPECAEAYLGKLMAELNIRKRDDLKNCKEPFVKSLNYQKAVRFGDSSLKNELENQIKSIKDRNEYELNSVFYNMAVSLMNSANTEDAYKDAAEKFKFTKDFKDSASLAEQCLEKAEIARKDAILASAKNRMKYLLADYYEEAIELFKSIPGWQDADECLEKCIKTLEEIKEKAEADRIEQERKAELARIEAEKRAKKIKKIILKVGSCVVSIIIISLLIRMLIIPSINYNKAMDLLEAKDYDSAYSILIELGKNDFVLQNKYERAIKMIETEDYDSALLLLNQIKYYKDSITKIIEIKQNKNQKITESQTNNALSNESHNLIETKTSTETTNIPTTLKNNIVPSIYYGYDKENLKNSKVGDCIIFGSYEQDNITSNGKEDIEWTVLEKKNDKILVISKYALECKPYNDIESDVTWKTSSIRYWLNNSFIDNAFTDSEKEMISVTTITTEPNPEYTTTPGDDTQDKIFLLSLNEAKNYFSSDKARVTMPTEYAVAQGACVNDDIGSCWWWLRSPGKHQSFAVAVYSIGEINVWGSNVSLTDMAVRPALWIAI